jgi:hypothetical protein
MKNTPTTIINPQSNDICKVMHQMAGNISCTLKLTHTPCSNLTRSADAGGFALATMMHATYTAILQSTLNVSLSDFVFQQDMFLDVPPIIANLEMIQEK